VADIVSRHELPVPRSDEVSVVSTSFSTVASLDTADISNSELGNYSSQERVDEPVFEQDVGSDEEVLPPHNRGRDSRLQSFSSSSSSDYSDDLTIAEWSEIGIEADHEVEVRATQFAASQVTPPQAVPLQHEVLRAPTTRVLRPRPAQRLSSSSQHIQETRFKVPRPNQEIDSGLDSTFQRLSSLWPSLPKGLIGAPIAVQWEIMRVLLHCQVDPAQFDLRYTKSWHDQKRLWSVLRDYLPLQSCILPDMSDVEAYHCALSGKFDNGGDSAVVLICTIRLTGTDCTPSLLLNPLKIEQSCRLFRRFRSSRFLEVRIPAVTGWKDFDVGDHRIEEVLASWLTRNPHKFLGRTWGAFFMRESAHATPVKDIEVVQDKKKSFQERIMLFSEQPREGVDYMLNWLLQFNSNKQQPFLKLYSRIALALSKTSPAAVLEQNQIRHKTEDILSSTGKVMNDGIGRVSLSLMNKVRDHLGLSETPAAFQARFGSAKGMWLVDFTDSPGEDWIETYPSQCKWQCDWSDTFHRTLEIKAVSTTLLPARLNLQMLQILSAQAIDRSKLKSVLGTRLETSLREEFQSLREADHPLLLRQWANDKASFFRELFDHDKLGGLPKSIEDRIAFLLDAGFSTDQKYLQRLIYQCQKQMCDKLSKDLKITIGKSTYAYMTIDFAGVLASDEVHICFSSFNDGENDRHDLEGRNILVGRCPAHLPSDIQKVKAVFKSELRHLRDVIVFPRTGDSPLADKLSGGDYDGDRAWVCWDEDIVDNFRNSKVPEKPKFEPYFEVDCTTVENALYARGIRKNSRHAVEKFLEFGLRLRYLGICTNHKEKLCYHKGSSNDPKVIAMSWLLSELVDLPKKGFIFTEADWLRFRTDIVGSRHNLNEPEYKKDRSIRRGEHHNIIDHLKFAVSSKVISSELRTLSEQQKTSKACFNDKDVCDYWDTFEERLQRFELLNVLPAGVCAEFTRKLKSEIKSCADRWRFAMNPDAPRSKSRTYWSDVEQIYALWKAINPAEIAADCHGTCHAQQSSRASSTGVLQSILEILPSRSETSPWELLKASLAFRENHDRNSTFVWQMAGEQLAFIKSYGTSSERDLPVPVTLDIYQALRPNKKVVKQMAAGVVPLRPRGYAGRQGRYPPGGYGDSSDDDGGSDGAEPAPLYELE